MRSKLQRGFETIAERILGRAMKFLPNNRLEFLRREKAPNERNASQRLHCDDLMAVARPKI